jgi:hypothetical protein
MDKFTISRFDLSGDTDTLQMANPSLPRTVINSLLKDVHLGRVA